MSDTKLRIPLVERDQAAAELQPLFDTLQATRGLVPNMFKTVAHTPALALGFAAFLKPLMGDGALPALYKELVATLVAKRLECAYCTTAHSIVALQKGGTREQLLDLTAYETGPFSEAEKAGFRAAERLHQSPHGVTDEVWAELEAHYSREQIIELIAVASAFEFFPRFVSALRIPVTPPPAGYEEWLAGSE